VVFYIRTKQVKEPVIPAQAGIQLIYSPRARGTTPLVLSASQEVYFCWIPACAGMTIQGISLIE